MKFELCLKIAVKTHNICTHITLHIEAQTPSTKYLAGVFLIKVGNGSQAALSFISTRTSFIRGFETPERLRLTCLHHDYKFHFIALGFNELSSANTSTSVRDDQSNNKKHLDLQRVKVPGVLHLNFTQERRSRNQMSQICSTIP